MKNRIKVRAIKDSSWRSGRVKKGQIFDGYIFNGVYWVELDGESVDFNPEGSSEFRLVQ